MTFFRSANPADLPQVNQLVNSAYRGESSKKGWTTEADLLDGQRTDEGKLLEMLSPPDQTIELAFAEDQKTLLGCVYLHAQGDTCYLGMLTVDPNLQARGLGKELLEHAEAFAKSKSCQRIRMTVIDTRYELISYYERRGYQQTGNIEPFPEVDPRFGIPKAKLQFVEMAKTIP